MNGLCVCFTPISLVEGQHPVADATPPDGQGVHTPEASVMLISPSKHLLMCSVTEWSIGTHLAIAEFVVARFRYIESDWSQSRHNPLALSIAEWIDLRVSATAPVVDFASSQVNMSWVNTSEGRKTRWSISSLLIWSAFSKWNHSLLWEISHIIH